MSLLVRSVSNQRADGVHHELTRDGPRANASSPPEVSRPRLSATATTDAHVPVPAAAATADRTMAERTTVCSAAAPAQYVLQATAGPAAEAGAAAATEACGIAQDP